jgi:hypothetical protein
MLVELRGTGSQTMAPSSIHPDTGGPVVWYGQGDPHRLEHAELLKCVEHLAAACLLGRYWPKLGARNYIGLALAGALARAAWTEDDAVAFIRPVAMYKGDEKTAEVRATFKRLRNSGTATGQPTCAQVFGEQAWKKVAEWLHLRPERAEVKGLEPPRPLRPGNSTS